MTWEFEFLSRFLKPLNPVLPHLIVNYSVVKMRVGRGSDEAAFADAAENCAASRQEVAKRINGVGTAVDTPRLAEKSIFLEAFAVAVERRSHWFMGCDCHEDLWLQDISYDKKIEQIRQMYPGHDNCMWEGKRCTEMALEFPRID